MNHAKEALRRRAREARSLLSPSITGAYSTAVSHAVSGLLNGCDTVMVYASKPAEVATGDLITDLIRRGIRVVVPIIERETCSLRLSYLTDPAVLVAGTFDVPEPLGHESPANAADIQAVIVPMLAYDPEGNRLGYGAGYYDRFLSRHPHLTKIGIAFSCQQVEAIPTDCNDIRMDYIVTEKGILTGKV